MGILGRAVEAELLAQVFDAAPAPLQAADHFLLGQEPMERDGIDDELLGRVAELWDVVELDGCGWR